MCSNDTCKFSHVKPSDPTSICRDFALNSYCEKGSSCEKLHSFECPDFAGSGHCNRPSCRLKHKEKQSIDRPLGSPVKDEGIVNTLQLANSLFAQPEESDSDSDAGSPSDESSEDEESEKDENLQEEELNNDFIKI